MVEQAQVRSWDGKIVERGRDGEKETAEQNANILEWKLRHSR